MLVSSGQDPNLNTMIVEEMHRQGYTISSMSAAISVNRGLLSASLNTHSKSLPIAVVDAITRVFGYADGWLYPAYMDDCFREGKAHWRRVKALLLRCLDINRPDLVKQTLDNLMEEPQYLQSVFKLAEELYESGRKQDAIPLYQCVVENEIKQHSERLAVSHYKWFRAEIDRALDMKCYSEAVLRFRPYYRRLPEHYQLDALLQLANTCFILQDWDQVENIAKEMLAQTLICLQQQRERTSRTGRSAKAVPRARHLVVYYGQSYLLRGNALEKQGKYEEAFSYLQHYEDLSGFDDLDEKGREEVRRLSVFAAANRLNLNILLGRFEFLDDYIAFLGEHTEERMAGLLTILEAALRYRKKIDEVLLLFAADIQTFLYRSAEQDRSYYASSFQLNRSTQLAYRLAVYQFIQNRVPEGLDYLLTALRHSVASNNEHLSLACAAWFERYRNQATEAHASGFKSIMKGVIQNEEEDYGITGGSYGLAGERMGAG